MQHQSACSWKSRYLSGANLRPSRRFMKKNERNCRAWSKMSLPPVSGHAKACLCVTKPSLPLVFGQSGKLLPRRQFHLGRFTGSKVDFFRPKLRRKGNRIALQALRRQSDGTSFVALFWRDLLRRANEKPKRFSGTFSCPADPAQMNFVSSRVGKISGAENFFSKP